MLRADISPLKRYLFIAGPWTLGIVTFMSVFIDPPASWADLPRQVCISLFVAEVCAASCYWGSYLVSGIENAIMRRLGRTPRMRSSIVYMLRGCVFLVPGMYVAFAILSAVAPRLGFHWHDPDLASYRIGLLIGFFTIALWMALDLYRSSRASSQRIKDLETLHLKAQLGALTSQMNPHLLFNALNSIASMIRERPEAAEDMTVALSGLYRKVLKASTRDTHKLADELNLCTAYLDIEKARFEERLTYSVTVAPGLDPQSIDVPVLCLQPLVENAVKHGILPKTAGGAIEIVVSIAGGHVRLEVSDDGVGYGAAPASKGAGTSVVNCRERLAMMYGGAAALEIGPTMPGTRAVLTFPVEGAQRNT